MSITSEEKKQLIEQYKINNKDTGSAHVQVALFTMRINNLTQHLIEFKKDNHSRRGLMKLIGKRKRTLTYLKNKDIAQYRTLITALNIRK